MAEKQLLNAGYLRAMEMAKQISGKDRGAASWLAVELKTSRQLLFHWSKIGFPDDVVPLVCRVTGLKPDQVRSISIDVPPDTWKRACEKLPKSILNDFTIRKS